MEDKIFLDTNIVVYAHDSSDPAKQARAQEILRDGMISGRMCVSAQVLGELFVVLTRKIAAPLEAEAAARIIGVIGKLEVVDLGLLAVRLALHIVMLGGISYWDALILAAAKLGGCSTVYSEDLAEGRLFGSVRVENPFTKTAG
jgi:predicted nucleic acid-binding protein